MVIVGMLSVGFGFGWMLALYQEVSKLRSQFRAVLVALAPAESELPSAEPKVKQLVENGKIRHIEPIGWYTDEDWTKWTDEDVEELRREARRRSIHRGVYEIRHKVIDGKKRPIIEDWEVAGYAISLLENMIVLDGYDIDDDGCFVEGSARWRFRTQEDIDKDVAKGFKRYPLPTVEDIRNVMDVYYATILMDCAEC